MNLKVKTLMNVLVLGGAALVSQSLLAEEQSTPTQQITKNPAFCSSKSPDICEPKAIDQQCVLVPKEGLECCWGTSCND